MVFLDRVARLAKRPAAAEGVARHAYARHVIGRLGREIASAKDFDARLGSALDAALGYFASQTAAIPGPFSLKGDDPAGVGPLFRNPDEIVEALGHSLAIRKTLPALHRTGHTHAYAILGMRLAQEGGTRLADHTPCSLAPTAAHSLHGVELAAFTRLLDKFKARICAGSEAAGGVGDAAGAAGLFGQGVVTAPTFLNPDEILRSLVAWLESPEDYLRIAPGAAGVASHPGSAAVSLPLMRSTDRRQWLVCSVRFPVEETMAALERTSGGRRYLLI